MAPSDEVSPSPSVRPNASSEQPKRPWYLVVALLVAWLFGTAGLFDGCMTMSFYQGTTTDPAAYARDLHDEANRQAVVTSAQSFIDTTLAARERGFPLAVAAFLLGAAMMALSTRAMAGRGGARSPLIQVVVVQAALAILTFLLTPDIRRAWGDLAEATSYAQARESKDPVAATEGAAFATRFLRVFPGAWLGARTGSALLILLALTRQRSRAFYDAVEDRRR